MTNKLFLAVLAVLLGGPVMAAQNGIFIEAERFDSVGGWSVDQQFMDQMGSPYLIAHGMGVPVEDAVTTVRIPQSEEAGVTGAAILAGIASGHFHADIPPALPIARTIHPSDRRENYAKQYADYRSIEKKLWAQGGTVK